MFQLTATPGAFLLGNKVIKADQYQSLVDAEGIIASAQEKARRIIEAAGQERESQKHRGYEDGLLEGRREMAERMIDAVGRNVDYFSHMEQKVVSVVIEALKKILGEMDHQEVILKTVQNALAVVRNQAKVTLRVCPDEAAYVRSRVAEILKQYPGVSYLDVSPDPRLQEGGCILETEMGVVDASVDVQLEAICRSLARSLTTPQ